MGNFLDTPITEKETSVDQDGKVAYGLSAMQGWRAQMEDDHVQLLSLSQEVPLPLLPRLPLLPHASSADFGTIGCCWLLLADCLTVLRAEQAIALTRLSSSTVVHSDRLFLQGIPCRKP